MKKNNWFNICTLYIFLWVLYFFHWQEVGEAFPILNSLSNLFLGINLLISIYYFVHFLTTYKQTPLFKALNILLISLVMYGFFSYFERDYVGINGVKIKSATYMIGALRTFLPIYACIMFTKLGYINEKVIRLWFWVFFVQSIIIFFISRVVDLGLDMYNMDDLRTNNRGYLFVNLFPLLAFFKEKSWLQYVSIAFMLILTIISVKRGAILIISLATIYFILHQFKKVSYSKKFAILIVFSIIVVQTTSFVENLYANSSVFQNRFESTMEGNSSGRDRIAKNLIEIYSSSDIRHLLFGFGADETLSYGLYAHNDWLEILFNQGIIGFVLYFLFWINLFLLWKKEKDGDLRFLMALWLLCNIPKSMFSMWYSMANIFVTIPLGYYLAKKCTCDRRLFKNIRKQVP